MSDDTLHGKPWEDLDTNPPGDWAETRAREWLAVRLGPRINLGLDEDHVRSLAALLREVQTEEQLKCGNARVNTLAEVRRVVEDVRAIWYPSQPAGSSGSTVELVCHEILARLEKL